MRTKTLALYLGVAMLSGVGIANAEMNTPKDQPAADLNVIADLGHARPPYRTSETKERWMSPAATAPAFVDEPGSALVLVSGYGGYSTKMDDQSGSCWSPPTSRTIRGR